MATFEWQREPGFDGVWTREYFFAPHARARTMTARAKDGSLVIVSPPSGLVDRDFDTLRSDGGVSAIVAPNGMHHLGLRDWSKAFPDARLFAPTKSVARITKKQPGLRAIEPLAELSPLLGDGVAVHDVPGISVGETWLSVKSGDALPIWYVADSCFSMAEAPPPLIPRLLFRLTRSAPGFQINGMGLLMFTKDKPAYRRFFLERLAAEAPGTVVTAHGEIVRQPNLRDTMVAMVEDRLG